MMPGVLFISNFLSKQVGTRSVAEELAKPYALNSWRIYTASHYIGRIPRLIDMVSAVIKYRRNYDLAYVEVYSGQAFAWAEVTCSFLQRLGKHYVLSLHGGGLPEFAQRSGKRVQRLLEQADRVVTPSRKIQTQLACLRSDILYIPNAIQLSNYLFRLRRQPDPALCWLRAFHKIYNPELAIFTLALLAPHIPEISLTMIGPDKQDGSLHNVSDLAKELGVDKRLNIIGRVDKSEVPIWLGRGEIFLNTTRFESFGVAVLEAAACGLPIVSTNVGELPYLWEMEKELILVPDSDPQAMADGVYRYLNTPGLAEQLTLNARKKAELHDWSCILPQWKNLFLELVNS